MTLEEAIIHCEEVAEIKRKQAENGDWEKGSPTECDCLECAEEHRQLAEWLKELRAFRERAPKGDRRVTCITCRHIDTRDMQGQAAPVSICRSKIWDGLHKEPHLIGHDPRLPILCNYWEPREEGQNDGKI